MCYKKNTSLWINRQVNKQLHVYPDEDGISTIVTDQVDFGVPDH